MAYVETRLFLIMLFKLNVSLFLVTLQEEDIEYLMCMSRKPWKEVTYISCLEMDIKPLYLQHNKTIYICFIFIFIFLSVSSCLQDQKERTLIMDVMEFFAWKLTHILAYT
jgi:hypothetical protein